MTRAKALVIAAEDEGGQAIQEGLQLGACSCGAKVAVGKKTRYDENRGRLYAMCTQCGATKGGFMWLTRMECVPHQWESCSCGPMKYWFQEEKHMFFCWRKDLGGCGAVRQVNYAPITGHRDCANCGIVYEGSIQSPSQCTPVDTSASESNTHRVPSPTVPMTLVEQASSYQMVLLHNCKVSVTKDGRKVTLQQLVPDHLGDPLSQQLCQPGNAIHDDFLFTQAEREVNFEYPVDVQNISKSTPCPGFKTYTFPYKSEDTSDVLKLD